MSQINFRFVIKMLGIIFLIETLFMLSATAVSFFYKEGDLVPFLISSGILFLTGIIFYALGFKANEYATGRREGMLAVALTWTLLSLFGMLPYYIGGYIDNITDAFFETMSGFTTTGASILEDIESLPKGILFWRSITQWQGGIGMIVFTVALMPIIGGSASLMFDAETTAITHERFRPRVAQTAKRLWGVYVSLTAILFIFLWVGPMDFFEAINHSLTTISTGGYSTKNTSIAHWNSAYIEYIISIFMYIGAINIMLIFFSINGQPMKLLRNEEFRWFTAIVVITTLITTIWLLFNGFETNIEHAFRKSLFQIVTLISSCGFATADFVPWGPFFWTIALIIMFIAGCAGSTSGGLKTGRFVIICKNLSNEFQKQTHPHAIIPVRMSGNVVSGETVHRILAFTFAYAALVVVSAIILMIDGVGFEESFGASVSSIGNIGPGLGKLGPAGNYAYLPDLSKWTLSFLMVIGRLEIFTVLTILLPGFWKR